MTNLPVEETPRDTCVWCGEEIEQAGVGRRRRYCSGRCRQQASIDRKVQRGVEEALAAREPEPGRSPGGPPQLHGADSLPLW